jgi:uncharacterized protein
MFDRRAVLAFALYLTCSVVALMVPCSSARAASFECEKARAHVEKLVCATEYVSVLDSRLGRAYALAIHDAYPKQKPGLISDQKAWIESTRDRCNDVECLTNAYMSRLRVLTAVKTAKTSAEYVTEEIELSAQTSAFQTALRTAGIPRSLSCTLMVRLVSDQFVGRDQSYGAICTMDSHRLMLCNDTMIGKLTVAFSPSSERGETVADFTANNCPPGG